MRDTYRSIFRPWVAETICFFLVMWQESFRLSARTAHSVLPVGKALQHFYYYNFGDFVNGYGIAFLAAGLLHILLFGNLKLFPAYRRIAGIRWNNIRVVCAGACVSALVIAIFELSPSGSTTSDIYDIPAGILGAAVFFVVRTIAIRVEHRIAREE
jgi:hypothetical protein